MTEMEMTALESIAGYVTLFVIVIGLMIGITIAIIRWLFRINERIDLLSQIRDELRKFNSSEKKVEK